MANVILFDDEAVPPNLTRSQTAPLTGVSVQSLKNKVDNYRTFVTSRSGASPNDVVLATTLTLQTVEEILDANEGSVGIRIYLYKESDTDSTLDAKFLVVPVYPNTDEVQQANTTLFTDKLITNTSGVVYLSACPKPACPPPPPGNNYSLL